MSNDEKIDFNIDEEEEIILDEEEKRAEEEGEDLFAEGWEDDYDQEQDEYDPSQIDDTQYDEISNLDRRKVEEKLNQQRLQRIQEVVKPGSYVDTLLRYNEDKPTTSSETTEKIKVETFKENISEDEDDDEEVEINLHELHGKVREWLVQDKARKAVSQKFKRFLSEYHNPTTKKNVYEERIIKMASENKATLEVSYKHLSETELDLCVLLADEPSEMLKIFNEIANNFVLSKFPDYKNIHHEIFVRITDLPVTEKIRDLRQNQLNQLIKISGVVTRRTTVFPQLQLVKFDCSKCNGLVGPILVNSRSNTIPKPSLCPHCEGKGPFSINQNQTIYRNYQKLIVQETPGTIPPGRIPRSKEVVLLNDLIDIVRPGEEIEITGIYKHNYEASMNTKHGFPVFTTMIEANHISKCSEKISLTISPQDTKAIIELSKDPNILKRIIKSIAPSIFGHENIKLALALALFGGQSKNIGGKHRIRGDINVLLVGDPGTSKSQFLKYIEKTAHRAIYTTGKGSTAVGLTASVHRDPMSKEWILEGGALVLADNGVCMIDEFDKMNDQDRTSIHEAMEQQSISISKAGIVTTLQARCSVIAASNPVKGRYDPTRTFHQNVQLSDPILSRFDILCVVKDQVDPIQDEQLATFVVDSHSKSHPLNKQEDKEKQLDEDIIPQDLLKKYLIYAKQNFNPKLQKINNEKLVNFYKDLRRESFSGGGIPISVRNLESLFRLSEACARLHLRDLVRDDDLNTAISVLLESFISTQKYSVSKTLRKKFSKYLTYDEDNDHFLAHLLQSCVKEHSNLTGDDDDDEVRIDLDEFKARAKTFEIFTIEEFLKNPLFTNHFSLDEKKKYIIKKFK